MATFLAALLVFIAAITGLSIGVILSNRCLKGTCGGLSSMPGSDGKTVCDTCSSAIVATEEKGTKPTG